MEQAISATHLVRRRESFGQIVVPAKGSVLASTIITDSDPEPDYFFHWIRDSAIVMRAAAELMHDASSDLERDRWRQHFDDIVRFSLALTRLDGLTFLQASRHRHATVQSFRKFLRPDAEICELVGDRLLAEPRFNPDGTIDFLCWSRPQFDGPALRALACLRYLRLGGRLTDELALLLQVDLAFTSRNAGRHCIGPWEEPEQNTHHYYVALVQLGALVHSKAWATNNTQERSVAESQLRAILELHWSERHQVYTAMWPATAQQAKDLVDSAALLAVLDADLPEGSHSVLDQRLQKTQIVIEAMFGDELAINHARPAGCAPILGRYRGDRYFGGGGWYLTTLAAAGLYYRRAQCPGQDVIGCIRRGDAFMAAIRNFVPADGALSEQIDRFTGQQTSARQLSWSHAAFVSTARLRRRALAQL